MSNYFNGNLVFLAIAMCTMVVTASAVANEENIALNQTDRTTGALDFIVYVCNSLNNCSPLPTGLVVDNNWRGVFYNLCYDQKKCDKIFTKAEYETLFGATVSASKTHLTLKYVKPATGPRIYLTTGPGSNKYQMVYLLNRELSFDVDLSTVGCGFDASLFFVAMEEDGGMASNGYTGPVYGTGGCDAQLPVPGKPSCYELDIIESNSLTTMMVTHTCNGTNSCEPSGCAYLPYALGKKKFYGRGPSYCVDTTKPFTIVTRFVSDDGTDTGNLKEIQRFYKQNGRTISNPTVSGNFNSISDAYCAYYNLNNLGGISSSMSYGLKKGMVLTMGMAGYTDNPDAWGWLDKEPNGPCPIYKNSYLTNKSFLVATKLREGDKKLNGGLIGDGLVREENTTGYQYSPLTLQSTLNLKSGDQLWVAIYSQSTGAYLHDFDYHHTHFTGFMLEEEILASL
uniref:cellulose 1,4-beta-cellobiosidase (non-reducing end) n=1 Tax=Daphnia galeata TaxID=27404 RepID=A0A8J2W276_9CRUS|nr:unnamed protein product [Daphnia galeata]